MDSEMTAHERELEAKAIADLERKIVKVQYTEQAKTKQGKEKVDTSKILSLAKKIRETYDHNDVALDGAH